MARLDARRLETLLTAAIAGGLAAALCVEALGTLGWRMAGDASVLHYVAWQVAEAGRTP